MTATAPKTRATATTSRDRQGAVAQPPSATRAGWGRRVLGNADALHAQTPDVRSLTVTARVENRSARAMSLLDMALAMAATAIVLFALCGVTDSLVADSADRQTLETVHALSRALDAYHQAHNSWPSAAEPTEIDSPMARCLSALRGSPATASMVRDLPGQTTTARGYLTLLDGFGQPMLYVHPGDPSETMKKLAARFPAPPGGAPFVVSAGKDGDFGDLAGDPDRVAAAADNLDSQ